MKVSYRATGDVTDLSEEAGRALVDAGICDAVEPRVDEPPPAAPRKKAPK